MLLLEAVCVSPRCPLMSDGRPHPLVQQRVSKVSADVLMVLTSFPNSFERSMWNRRSPSGRAEPVLDLTLSLYLSHYAQLPVLARSTDDAVQQITAAQRALEDPRERGQQAAGLRRPELKTDGSGSREAVPRVGESELKLVVPPAVPPPIVYADQVIANWIKTQWDRVRPALRCSALTLLLPRRLQLLMSACCRCVSQFLNLFTAERNRAICLFEVVVSLCYNPSVRSLLSLFFQEADKRRTARSISEQQMAKARTLLSLCLQRASSTLGWLQKLREIQHVDGPTSGSVQDAVSSTDLLTRFALRSGVSSRGLTCGCCALLRPVQRGAQCLPDAAANGQQLSDSRRAGSSHSLC